MRNWSRSRFFGLIAAIALSFAVSSCDDDGSGDSGSSDEVLQLDGGHGTGGGSGD